MVDKKELAEILVDDPAFNVMADLLMALAEGDKAAEEAALVELRLLAKAKHYELSGEADEDEARAEFEHNDFVASVNYAATH